MPTSIRFFFFFFNDTATTEIYTLSLHDALPISAHNRRHHRAGGPRLSHDALGHQGLPNGGRRGRAAGAHSPPRRRHSGVGPPPHDPVRGLGLPSGHRLRGGGRRHADPHGRLLRGAHRARRGVAGLAPPPRPPPARPPP